VQCYMMPVVVNTENVYKCVQTALPNFTCLSIVVHQLLTPNQKQLILILNSFYNICDKILEEFIWWKKFKNGHIPCTVSYIWVEYTTYIVGIMTLLSDCSDKVKSQKTFIDILIHTRVSEIWWYCIMCVYIIFVVEWDFLHLRYHTD